MQPTRALLALILPVVACGPSAISPAPQETSDRAASPAAALATNEAPRKGAVLHLDPTTLNFFSLGINDLRWAVAGYDTSLGVCATVVFPLRHAYVFLVEQAAPPCEAWSYSGNAEVRAVKGRMNFGHLQGGADFVDMTVELDHPRFAAIVLKSEHAESSLPE
jgi:hypothetical protein